MNPFTTRTAPWSRGWEFGGSLFPVAKERRKHGNPLRNHIGGPDLGYQCHLLSHWHQHPALRRVTHRGESQLSLKICFLTCTICFCQRLFTIILTCKIMNHTKSCSIMQTWGRKLYLQSAWSGRLTILRLFLHANAPSHPQVLSLNWGTSISFYNSSSTPALGTDRI